MTDRQPCQGSSCNEHAVYFVSAYESENGGKSSSMARYCPMCLIAELPAHLACESYVNISFARGADVMLLPGFPEARERWIAEARRRVDEHSVVLARPHGKNSHTQAQRREALVEAGLVHPDAIDLIHPTGVYDMSRTFFGWDD